MASKYYIVNPTQHTLQIYDIIRILPGTEDEPCVTECTITNDVDLEAVKGIEGWGMTVLNREEYEAILAELDPDVDENEEDDKSDLEPEKIKVSTVKSKDKKAAKSKSDSEVVANNESIILETPA